MKNATRLMVTASAAAMMLHPGIARAQAQEPETKHSAALAEADIIVTARRQSERLQDIPVAVTALDKSFLENHTVQNLTELSQYVAGIKIETTVSPDQYILSLRGQRSSLVLSGVDPAVGLYVNEVPYSLAIGASQQFYDLESIQVLKGPQGTLFGQSTTGGAVLFTTARPTDVLEGSLKGGVKFFNGNSGYYGTAVLNLPVSEKLSVRIAASGIDREGYIKNKGPFPPIPGTPIPEARLNSRGTGDFSDDREINGRLSILFKPTDTVESLTVGTYGKMWTNGTGKHWTANNPNGFVQLVYGFYGLDAQQIFSDYQSMLKQNFWSAVNPIDQYVNTKTWGILNNTSIELSDTLTLRNIINYRHFHRDQRIEVMGAPFSIITPNNPVDGHEWSEELQLQGHALDGKLDFTSGLFFFEQKTDVRTGGVVLSMQPTDVYSNNVARSYAVYAQGTYSFTDQLSLTLGGRYTWDDRTVHIDGLSRVVTPTRCSLLVTGGGAALPIDACVIANSVSYSTPTWTVSLNYKLDPETLLYLAHRRGYRSGGLSLYGTSLTTALPFKPEKVTDIEFGTKRTWFLGGEASLITNLAAYYSDYKDAIRNISPPGGNPADILLTNASSAKIYGGELEMTLIPVKGLTIAGSAAYVHAKFGDFPTANGDATGNPLANVPRWALTGSIRYAPMDNENGKISLGVEGYYQSMFWFDDENQTPGVDGPIDSIRQPGYGLLSLRVDWENVMGSNIKASAFVTNLTKTEYYLGGSTLLYTGLGANAAVPGDPRVFGIELGIDF
ncbi:TonB-dependent receptor [Novosphingobium malaysiense]|uniref:TonB-dependent receptor n=1 Tax=Novosphingobium malaysiense TaxID=1348853 RepID=A0A0B1ZID3_9SPHN|nr:TonB-dependent receptor [Novosphingobium malaysiense]KHK89077.1 hypothetical protein LK12_22335 [Novosphingobium malaysiense]